MTPKELGQLIKNARESVGKEPSDHREPISKAQMAKKLHMGLTYYKSIEAGTAYGLAQACDIFLALEVCGMELFVKPTTYRD